MTKLGGKYWWWPIPVLLVLVLAAYGKILQGYFSTDEWWAFSYAITIRDVKETLIPSGVYAPAANFFIWWLYKTFGLNATAWAIIILIIHSISTLLVYWATSRLSGNRLVGLTAAACFAVAPMGSQFIHQFAMMPTSGMATMIALGGLVAYSYRRSVLAGLLLLASLFFSPYATPVVLIALTFELVLFERKKWWHSLVRWLPVIAAFGLYYYAQTLTTFKNTQLHDRPVSGDNGTAERITHIIQKVYQSYGELLTFMPGTIDSNLMVRYSTIVIVVVVLLVGLIIWRKQYQLAKSALIGLLWIPLSVSLFATLNTTALDATFPSRYFYVSSAGLGLLIGSLAAGLFAGTYKKIALGNIAVAVACLVMLAAYLPKTQAIVTAEINTGSTRKMIMDTVTRTFPSVGRDSLFCFTSNTGHYAADRKEIAMPFIHNFAFNLAVVYKANEPLLRPFFTESGYFVNPAASFYYFVGDQRDMHGIGPGIGYATSAEKCKAVRELHGHVIGLEDIYGFAYDGEKPVLRDVTDSMRRYVGGDESALADLYP